MNDIRTKKIASTLHREISDIIATEIRDEDLKMVTITDLKLANDLSYAKIYFTTIFTNKKDKVLLDLNNARGFIKSELCKRKLEIRAIPELEFIYDTSLEYASNIEKILKEIKENQEK